VLTEELMCELPRTHPFRQNRPMYMIGPSRSALPLAFPNSGSRAIRQWTLASRLVGRQMVFDVRNEFPAQLSIAKILPFDCTPIPLHFIALSPAHSSCNPVKARHDRLTHKSCTCLPTIRVENRMECNEGIAASDLDRSFARSIKTHPTARDYLCRKIVKAATLVMLRQPAPAREPTAWMHAPSQPLM